MVEQLENDLPASQEGIYFSYVLYCSDGSLYKGQTTNLKKRYEQHKNGQGAEHTKKYRPLYVYHYETHKTLAEALSREKYFKSGNGRDWLKKKNANGQLRQAGGSAKELLKEIERLRV